MSQELLQIVLSGVLAFGCVYALIPAIRKFAQKKNLFDVPDEKRKIHTRLVSNLGGVAIFYGIVIGFSISGYAYVFAGYPYLMVAFLILFVTGLIDDIDSLSPRIKLMIEVVACLLVIYGADFRITDFHGLFGIHELSVWASVGLTLFTLIVVTNAFNLIDGIDGLAAGTGIIACLFFFGGFMLAGKEVLAALSIFTAISLSAFLWYNFPPAKIFMGDTGSLVVGFILGLLAVRFTTLSSLESFQLVMGNSSAAFAAIILMIPLYDTIRVFVRRLSRGQSPFKPDNDHIHHVLIRRGYSHKGASLLLFGLMIWIIGVNGLFVSFNPNILIITGLASCFLFLPTNGLKRRFLGWAGLNIGLKPQEAVYNGIPKNGSRKVTLNNKLAVEYPEDELEMESDARHHS